MPQWLDILIGIVAGLAIVGGALLGILASKAGATLVARAADRRGRRPDARRIAMAG